MNAHVAHLLADYFRRTLGGWALLVLAELLQTSVFWAARIQRAPLLGAVIASLLYHAALNSPQAVFRTLPLSRRDVGLFRWWVALGAPGSIILVCTLVAAVTNSQHGWWIPSSAGIVMTAGFSLALLGWLAALPLPTMGASGRTRSRFALVWGTLTLAAMYGAPLAGLPAGWARGLAVVMTAAGIGMGAWLLVRAAGGAWPTATGRGGWSTGAERGRWAALAEGELVAEADGNWGAGGRGSTGARVEASAQGAGLANGGGIAADTRGSAGVGGPEGVGGPKGAEATLGLCVSAENGRQAAKPSRATLTGWRLLAAEVARSTAYLSVVALSAITAVRACVTPWFLSAFEPALIWMLASAVAVAGSFLTRRWMLTVRSLRLLPIGDYRLAFILYVILITPGVVTGLILMGTRQLMPDWGLEMPGYMFVLFLLAPAVSVPWQKQHAAASASVSAMRQWSPVLQQAAFPLWAGSLCAFGGPHLQPSWFVAFLALFGAVGTLGGYIALLVGIRSPQGLEV